MPYIHPINKNSTDSHQTSPAYVLTFVRWSNRDTVNYKEDPINNTRNNLVVINDIVNIQISDSKESITGSLSVVLKAGDINYATAFSPGDYVIVNLLDNEKKAMEVYNRATSNSPINRYNDGFKGLYKIQKIRRQIAVDPASGQKQYQFTLHAFSFTELNSVILFNPTAAATFQDKGGEVMFLAAFSEWWSGRVSSENNIQNLLIDLTKSLLGIGLNNKTDSTMPISQNSYFVIPPSIGSLLGKTKKEGKSKGKKSATSEPQTARTITDIYNFVFGVWKSRSTPEDTIMPPSVGFNPGVVASKDDNNFFVVDGGLESQLKGYNIVQAEDFNQKKIWTIIQSYSNSAINEAYTANRVGIDGLVHPTIVVRQKPFSSNQFNSPDRLINNKENNDIDFSHTKFSEIPCWKISTDLIYSVDLGKDDIGRVNFVQLYGRSLSIVDTLNQALQANNIYYDQEDIKRHGMRPAVMTSNFDFPIQKGGELQSKKWSYLLFDMLNAGHLRESGTISCYGIVDPISVGDNVLFDGSYYHIEAISHTMAIDGGSGAKNFRTNLTVSFGTSASSTSTTPVYSQMNNTDAGLERSQSKEDGLYTGFSDTQHLPNSEGNTRELGEEITSEIPANKTFTGAPVSGVGAGRLGTIVYKEKTTNKKNGGKK